MKILFYLTLHYVLDINTPRADCTDGDVRLANGRTEYEGRVEVCINRAWGTVCTEHHERWWWWRERHRYRYEWSTQNSNTVCKQLGHMRIGKMSVCLRMFYITQQRFNSL